MINDGVLIGRQPNDWVHGQAGALPYEVRNPSGDWTAYLPSAERQSNRRTETFACVSYSCLNVIETQVKFLTGQELNFSDRWLAKMSGTTMAGNYLSIVADIVRKKGLVEQPIWPEPLDYTWDSYYASIPPSVQSKGLEFLKNWTIAYEWVSITKESLLKHLKHAPLQLIIPGHAIMGFYQEADVTHFFDTYDPFTKTTTPKNLTDALKIVLTPKGEKMKLVNDNGTVFLVGEKGKIGIADEPLFNALKTITDVVDGSTAGILQTKVVESAETFLIKDN